MVYWSLYVLFALTNFPSHRPSACLTAHHVGHSHRECSLFCLVVKFSAFTSLTKKAQCVHTVPALELDQSPGQFLTQSPLPLGQPWLQDAVHCNVLPTQFHLPLQLLLLHAVEPVRRAVAVHQAQHPLHLHGQVMSRMNKLHKSMQCALQVFNTTPSRLLHLLCSFCYLLCLLM